MQRCSEKAFAMCPTRHLCGTIEEATFADDSECAQFNREVEDKPMTNADKIRAMSDMEMARFLAEVENRRAHYGGGAKWNGAAHAFQWLQQPAEGE